LGLDNSQGKQKRLSFWAGRPFIGCSVCYNSAVEVLHPYD